MINNSFVNDLWFAQFNLCLYFKGLSFCDELKIRRHYNRPGLRGGKVKFRKKNNWILKLI